MPEATFRALSRGHLPRSRAQKKAFTRQSLAPRDCKRDKQSCISVIVRPVSPAMLDTQPIVRSLFSGVALRVWRALQALVLIIGIVIVGALFVAPRTGLHLLWNVLIPVAPALLVVAPGVWRNVCPMATFSLLPRHFGLSRKKHLGASTQGWMAAGALALLLLIVPLRHVIFDTNGPAIGIALVVVALLAAGLGMAFEWKSAWCSGLCPVYPVELLYGQSPLVGVQNAHCRTCENCVSPCRDATADLNPANFNAAAPAKWSGLALVGGFPGFIWGWFQVPDYQGWEGFRHLPFAYGVPLSAMAATLVLFLGLRLWLKGPREVLLIRAFAAAAVIVYYWFRLPGMLGFGGDPAAALIDMRSTLPSATPTVLRALAISVFAWLIVAKPRRAVLWAAKAQVSR
ncbi:MAG: hypothetical protein IT462_03655 [Planctomycetes bacterium]|nr:hypothetical protein [Planctomycetota bacterium]